jgi:hypothetical protein
VVQARRQERFERWKERFSKNNLKDSDD